MRNLTNIVFLPIAAQHERLAIFRAAQAHAVAGRQAHDLRQDLFRHGDNPAHGPRRHRRRRRAERPGENTPGLRAAVSSRGMARRNGTRFRAATTCADHAMTRILGN